MTRLLFTLVCCVVMASPASAVLWYFDGDGDTYGDPDVFVDAASPPPNYVADNTDCDDGDSSVNPGATEVTADGIDNNCDGLEQCHEDSDIDGFGSDVNVISSNDLDCFDPGESDNDADCDDTLSSVFPGAPEVCNGIDDNCNGQIDEGAGGGTTWYRDMDADTYGDPAVFMTACTQPAGYVADNTDCDDGNSSVNPGATETTADGIDNNCDGLEQCYEDSDIDGFGSDVNVVSSNDLDCFDPGESDNDADCDDTLSSVFPGAPEVCNGIDDNCNGQIDEGAGGGTTWYRDMDADTYGDPAVFMTACTQPAGYVADNTDCDDSEASTNPGAVDVPGDGVDNDCDGSESCYRDLDGDGFGSSVTVSSADLDCDDFDESSMDGDCDDTDFAVFPGAAEICNGVDDNCDSVIDEGCPTYGITSIADVGNDQGRNVRVRWYRHPDDAASAVTILGYSVYRRIEPGLKAPPGDWDFLVQVPATGEDTYSTVVPSLCDSTSAGICWTTLFVRAHTPDPITFFDSMPDSGYSVDNLAPQVPKNLVANYGASGNALAWDESVDSDFSHFRVYRSTDPGFVPGPASFLGATTSPNFQDVADSSWPSQYYRVSSVDFNGNESEAVSPGIVTAVPEVPAEARLSVHPNPFNPRTVVAFELPRDEPRVVVRVYAVDGRLVRTLVDASLGAGTHDVSWSGQDEAGAPVASGVYYVELQAGAERLVRRAALVR